MTTTAVPGPSTIDGPENETGPWQGFVTGPWTDGVVEGGVGATLAQRVTEAGLRTPVLARGIPAQFLEHASIAQLVEAVRLRPEDLAADVLGALAAEDA